MVRARDQMRHRGPDGAGLWSSPDGRVVLGHRRLAILDPTPRGAQPMRDEDAGLTLVFNGEIYNFRDLRQELEALGSRFYTDTDTEVILQLYRHFGIGGLGRLRGMFAIALWDERRRGLLLARDGMGIKPLYVFDEGGRVGAASELRAAQTLLPQHRRSTPEMAGHLGFFLYGWVPEPFTPLVAVRMMPAGCWRWIDEAGSREGRFFDLVADIVEAEGEAPRPHRAEGLEELRAAIRDSVARHLIADVPVSLFLSAGVDSSAIAAFASGAGAAPLEAVTLGTDLHRGGHDDEVPQAQATSRDMGLRHHVRWLARADFLERQGEVLAAMDSPSVDGVNAFFVSAAAADCGFKVALSGVGGDELFGGYPSFHQIPALVSVLGVPARLSGLGRRLRLLAAPLCGRMTSPKWASLLELAGGYADAYRLRRALFLPWELEGRGDPREIADALEHLDAVTGFDNRYSAIRSPVLRVLALESELYMRGQLLRNTDWAGMACSLEVRLPLVDTVLFRTAVRVAAGLQRPLAKTDLGAMAGGSALLAAQRRKTSFSLPVAAWLAKGAGPTNRGLSGWAAVVYRDWCNRHGVPLLLPGGRAVAGKVAST